MGSFLLTQTSTDAVVLGASVLAIHFFIYLFLMKTRGVFTHSRSMVIYSSGKLGLKKNVCEISKSMQTDGEKGGESVMDK